MAYKPKKKPTREQMQAAQAAHDVVLLTQALARFVTAGALELQESYGWSQEESAAWAMATMARARKELFEDGGANAG